MNATPDWREESCTGLQLVAAWVDREFPTAAAAARALGVSPQQLWGYLNEPERGWDKELCFRAARTIGIPIEALLFKNVRLCDLYAAERDLVLKAAG